MVDFAKARAEANAKVAQEKLGLSIPSKVPPASAALADKQYLTELELIEAVEDVADEETISKWEEDFLKSLKKWVCSLEAPSEKPLTPKQRQVLLKLCVRLDIEMTHAPSQLRSPPAPTLPQYTQSKAPRFAFDDMDDDIPF
jgi:hypothetical protein